MNHPFTIIFFIFITSCSSLEKKAIDPPLKQPQAQDKTINYDSCKKAVQLLKQQNKTAWKRFSRSQKETLFTRSVAETIIPGWIGTNWSFNGTTETPGQGSIACGYFVTTVLRDAGLDLARIKLAQCPSEQMIRSLVQAKYISRFSDTGMEEFMGAVKEPGLYIAGLDNHTGFIYNDGKDIYFIHSTFVGTRNVQKEKAAGSRVLQASRYKVIGRISADETVLERWIN